MSVNMGATSIFTNTKGIKFEDGTVQTTASTGGGGSANKVQVVVDFGFASGLEGDVARTTVTGQSWVTATSILVCSPAGAATATHDAEDAALEGLVAYAENLVPGVGFDIVAKACGDSGNTFGQYVINVLGQ